MATGNLSHRSGDLPARQAAAQGFALLSQDGLSQAKALFDQALASSPDCLAARLGLALLSEDYRQARRLCPEMLEVEKTLRGPMLLTYLAGFAAVGDENTGRRFAKPIGIEAINDYTSESHVHRGYDGPCPPGFDARMHGYEFRVFALDVKTLSLPDTARWAEVQQRMAPHVLAAATIQGIYSLNPRLQTA